MHDLDKLRAILYYISQSGYTVHSLLSVLLALSILPTHNVDSVLGHLASDPLLSADIHEWALKHVRTTCVAELAQVADKKHGYHFNAVNLTAEKVASFSINNMADNLQRSAPTTWELMGALLDSHGNSTSLANPTEGTEIGEEREAGFGFIDDEVEPLHPRIRRQRRRRRPDSTGDVAMEDAEAQNGAADEGSDSDDSDEDYSSAFPENRVQRFGASRCDVNHSLSSD